MVTEDKVDTAKADNTENADKKRSVVISRTVKVLFKHKSGKDTEAVECNRDVYSVTDVIGQKLAALNGKDELDDVLVSVHSVEDVEKSEAPADGEERWEGPYGVAGVEVEDKSIPDAMTDLAKAMIPADAAMRGVERLAEQYFLRTRLDGFVFIGTFDGQPAVIPLISSFKERKPECFAMLYRQLHIQDENLKAWTEKTFPDLAASTDWTGTGSNRASAPSIVGPDGNPVVPNKPVLPGIRLQTGSGCGKSCRRK